MAKQLAEDLADVLMSVDIKKEIAPMKSTIENIDTRNSEISQILIPPISHDTEVAQNHLSQIMEYSKEFDELCGRIDQLESIVAKVKSNLDEFEAQVDIAEQELKLPVKNSFLKSINIFARQVEGTNLDEHGNYKPPEIFKTEELFESKD